MFERGRWRFFRGTGRVASRNDTEHLRSTRANEARLNAAIEELNAGRGSLISMSEVEEFVRGVRTR